MCWDAEVLGFKQEMQELAKCFSRHFGYAVEYWLIPSMASEAKLIGRLQQVVDKCRESDELLGLYYGGHSYLEGLGGIDAMCLAGSRQHRNGPGNAIGDEENDGDEDDEDSDGASGGEWQNTTLRWKKIRENITVPPHRNILLILDCCHLAGITSAPENSSGREGAPTACCWSPAGGVNARISYTMALIRTLYGFKTEFTIADMQSRLCTLEGMGRERISSRFPQQQVLLAPISMPTAGQHPAAAARPR
ncbi:hypothetical protein LTR85_008275 [Meristemomyces frigidus]|nr:hypothetical protein LTR85_008275 [Meristemomyces frigidus]